MAGGPVSKMFLDSILGSCSWMLEPIEPVSDFLPVQEAVGIAVESVEHPEHTFGGLFSTDFAVPVRVEASEPVSHVTSAAPRWPHPVGPLAPAHLGFIHIPIAICVHTIEHLKHPIRCFCAAEPAIPIGIAFPKSSTGVHAC